MTKAIRNETKKLKATLTGKSAHDSRELEEIFESCRYDEDKMLKLVRAFCETYLIDNKQRALKLRPLQEEIIVKSLTHREDGGQRKLAILAPRGSGKSYALAVAVTIYMFFKRFRDLIFVLAPSEDQAALIFGYVYRNFKDNRFLDSLVDNYKFHNKPHIRMKGGTMMRRAPLAPSNQGQAIRGQHPTMCIVDESPLIDDRLFVDNVEPAIVSNKAPFINLGTPKSKENHMYRYLYDEAYEPTFTRLHFTW
jgi:phage terminase large subunit-like protein